jgi:NitT/TauT family transport system ATP-binding protein
MIRRIFGVQRGLRGFKWADVVVLLSLVGLLAIVAWLGRALWAPFTPDAPLTLELDPWRLPAYAARSLLRMFAALGASLVFTLVVASWAARSVRKELFRTALQLRATLVMRIYAALSGKADRRLSGSFFLGLLEQHFSAAEARRQLDTAIDWGRYAELFGFEDDTNELYLEPAE